MITLNCNTSRRGQMGDGQRGGLPGQKGGVLSSRGLVGNPPAFECLPQRRILFSLKLWGIPRPEHSPLGPRCGTRRWEKGSERVFTPSGVYAAHVKLTAPGHRPCVFGLGYPLGLTCLVHTDLEGELLSFSSTLASIRKAFLCKKKKRKGGGGKKFEKMEKRGA